VRKDNSEPFEDKITRCPAPQVSVRASVHKPSGEIEMVGDVATYTVRFRVCLADNWPAPTLVAVGAIEYDALDRSLMTVTLTVAGQGDLIDFLNELNDLGAQLLAVREQSSSGLATTRYGKRPVAAQARSN
jgi:hypothetical protein